MRVVKLIIIILLTGSLVSCNAQNAPSNSIIQSNGEDIEELENTIQELEKRIEDYKIDYRLADEDRRLYREEILRIINLLNNLNSVDDSVFTGFNDKNVIHMEHKRLIKTYLNQYIDNNINDPDITKEIEPIIWVAKVKPSQDLIMKKEENIYYYSVTFYSSLIPVIMYEKKSRLRGAFDGFKNWVLQIENIDGEWRVKDFGPDS